MKQQGKNLSYYLASVAGFAIGFAGIISPFAYYQVVKANEVIYQNSRKFTLPSSLNLMSAVVKLPVKEEKIHIPNQNVASNIAVENKLPELKIIDSPEALPKSDIKLELDKKLLSKGLLEKELTEESPRDVNRFANRLRDGKKVKMVATAYCLNGRTASGVFSKYGIIAADPKYLPIGSIVRIRGGEYTGFYSVLDTGGKIKGRKIDIYLASGKEAAQFGRRDVTLEVLRYGWNPQICNDMILEEQKTFNVSIR